MKTNKQASKTKQQPRENTQNKVLGIFRLKGAHKLWYFHQNLNILKEKIIKKS